MADGAIEADRHYLGSPQLSKDGSKLAALEGDSWKIISWEILRNEFETSQELRMVSSVSIFIVRSQ